MFSPNVLEQARLGNLDLFRTELESGNHPLDFKAGRDQYFNRTPLHLAAMEGQEEIVEFILSRSEISRDVMNAKDCFGYTPLHLAARRSRENVVRLLTTSSLVLPDRFLAATSEPDDLDRHSGGWTPLHFAAVTGHIAIAKFLLRQPCQVEFAYDPVNIFAMNWRNWTPLDIARHNKFQDLGDFLEASDLNCVQQELTRTSTSANAILVGAALVLAAAFGAWLQPPGGMPNPDSGASSPSPSALSWSEYNMFQFYLSVTLAFGFSLMALQHGVLATFPTGASVKVDLRRVRLLVTVARNCLLAALFFLTVAFSTASILIFDKVVHNVVLRQIMGFVPAFTTLFVFTYYRDVTVELLIR